jgi:hypothetical protein
MTCPRVESRFVTALLSLHYGCPDVLSYRTPYLRRSSIIHSWVEI